MPDTGALTVPTLLAAACTALASTSDCVSIDTDSIDIKLSDVSSTVERVRSSSGATGTLLCILCDTKRYSYIVEALGEVAEGPNSEECRGEDLLCILEDLRTEWCSRLCWLSGYFVYQYVNRITDTQAKLTTTTHSLYLVILASSGEKQIVRLLTISLCVIAAVGLIDTTSYLFLTRPRREVTSMVHAAKVCARRLLAFVITQHITCRLWL